MLPNAHSRRTAIWLLAAAALAAPTVALANIPPESRAVAASPAKDGAEFARRGRGKDDGPNHDKNDDRGRDERGRGRGKDDGPKHSAAPATRSDTFEMARRGRGKDDEPGHSRRGRGKDDGPNHG